MALADLLPTVNLFTKDDVYHYTVENRPLLDLISRDISLANAIDNNSVSYSLITPNSGFSITIDPTSYIYYLLVNPISTIASGTIIMPANPVDKHIIKIIASQTITSLTLNANSGQVVLNAPTTLLAGTSFEYMYIHSITTWFRIR